MFTSSAGKTADDDRAVVVVALVAMLLAAFVGVIGAATARDDAGIHAFFNGEAGGSWGLRATVEPGAAPSTTPRPLMVRPGVIDAARPRPRRTAAKLVRSPARTLASRVPLRRVASRMTGGAPLPPVWDAGVRNKPALVSIYEDRTLRRGDAVMTGNGIRVFAGSRTFPYRPEDFRKVAMSKRIELPFRRALMEIDRFPRFAS